MSVNTEKPQKDTSTMVVTRKIQIRCEDVSFYEMLKALNKDVFRMANMMMARLYTVEAVENEMMFNKLVEKKAELKEILYGKEGALTDKSKQNIPYALSAQYFAHVPSAIRGALASNIFAKFKEDAFDVSLGRKTQATFRYGMPIPFMKQAINQLTDTGFTFLKYQVDFVFGADKSNNKSIIQKIIDSEYTMCDSSIQYEGKKTFLLLAVRIQKPKVMLDKSIMAEIDISHKCPITISLNSLKSAIEVGSLDKHEHIRRQLQNRFQKAQIAAKYAKGGHGRDKKLQVLERFHELEKNTASTLAHTLTAEVLKVLLRNNVGTVKIIAEDVEEIKNNDEKHYVIRNFGLSMIKEKLIYKLKRVNIVIE